MIFGGGEEYTIVGKGNIQFLFGGKDLIFHDVYFVSCMELNLLSVSQIMHHSPQLDVVFSSHKWSIVHMKIHTTTVVGLEDHCLYRLVDSGDSSKHASAAKSTSINNLWDQQYGHLSIHYLSQLVWEVL
ncbi:hypothetical protein SUGI_0783050 [Cryptomeria japonica]|nr:hypothetical protein SUGI_0783050 [Cryptomeria japonica]